MDKTKNKVFIVSDVHGCAKELLLLLTKWNPEEEFLIINGDIVDRGANSKQVIGIVYRLVLDGFAVVNWGNHDRMMWDFLQIEPEEDPHDFIDTYYLWYYQGGRETSDSILNKDTTTLTPEQLQIELKAHTYVTDLMGLMTWYYEFGNVLIVHAGVPPEYQLNIKATPKLDLIWYRGHYKAPNRTGKVMVSGHTPTHIIRNGGDDIWFNTKEDIYLIDGACAYGGQLNGVVFTREGKLLDSCVVKNDKLTIKQKDGVRISD